MPFQLSLVTWLHLRVRYLAEISNRPRTGRRLSRHRRLTHRIRMTVRVRVEVGSPRALLEADSEVAEVVDSRPTEVAVAEAVDRQCNLSEGPTEGTQL